MPGDPGAEEHPAGIALRLALIHGGWRESPEQIQFRNTYRLDLRPSEDDLLAAMKQKTRYNVRLAERRGVAVRPAAADDLEVLYRMYAETSLRDRFAIRAPGYYHDVWGTFMRAGLAQAFIAQVDGQPVAGLIVYRFGRAAYYLFGMSRAAHRDRMPNHRLQWEAIRWAKVQGCTVYDLWGAPDRLDARDRMWGVHRFKEGFGGDLVRTLGAWDYPLRPGLYRMYTSILPRVLALMRLRGRARVRATVEATL
jgi:lipid II:glycine glycyltransferase (peptidoglycan interpeptide bridge formation enzyme)